LHCGSSHALSSCFTVSPYLSLNSAIPNICWHTFKS
jgi:hypothetical protein